MSKDEINSRSRVTLYWVVWLAFALSYLTFHFFFLGDFVAEESQLKFFVAAYGVPCVLVVMLLNKIESNRLNDYLWNFHPEKVKEPSDLYDMSRSDIIPHKEESFAEDPVYQALKENHKRFPVFALIAFSSFIPLALIIRFIFPYLEDILI